MIDLQREITLKKFRAEIGNEVQVYVETVSRKSDDHVSGKTEHYKIAVLEGGKEQLGQFVNCTVKDATAGTLICY